MTEYSNENRGSIWRNEKKERDTHPDFTGTLNVAGVEYWVSAWKRKDGASDRAPALSFSIKPKDEQKPATKKSDPISSGRSLKSDMDDDLIPFAPEFR